MYRISFMYVTCPSDKIPGVKRLLKRSSEGELYLPLPFHTVQALASLPLVKVKMWSSLEFDLV